QHYRASLLPWLDARENVAFPLRIQGESRAARTKHAVQLLQDFAPEISPTSRTYELSGGQQQLICLLRAAAGNPDALLLDEPFAALDQQSSWSMAAYVERIWSSRNIPILFVSHDVDTALLLAGEIHLMTKHGGTIAKC